MHLQRLDLGSFGFHDNFKVQAAECFNSISCLLKWRFLLDERRPGSHLSMQQKREPKQLDSLLSVCPTVPGLDGYVPLLEEVAQDGSKCTEVGIKGHIQVSPPLSECCWQKSVD